MVVAATLVPAHKAARAAGPTSWIALLALDAVVVAGAAIVVRDENSWQRLAQEDGVIEWATVFAFAIAAFLLLRLLPGAVRAPSRNALLAVAVACIGLFCVFVAGEEISWGQRLFAFKPPDAFLEKNFQQEMNLHNVLMDERGLGFKLESKHLVAAIALLYGVVGPLLARLPALAAAARAFPPLHFAPAFLAVLALELTYGFELAGEGAELLLGLCFVGALGARHEDKRTMVWLALPLALGALTAPLLARVVFGADEQGVTQARAELSALAGDLERGLTDKLDKKKSIHKRVFTAARDGYLDVDGGAFLEGKASRLKDGAGTRDDRRGYFLDPWNNPYWIFAQRGAKQLVIYSFGPNRQRDSEIRTAPIVGGDDVVVIVPRAPRAAPDEAPDDRADPAPADPADDGADEGTTPR